MTLPTSVATPAEPALVEPTVDPRYADALQPIYLAEERRGIGCSRHGERGWSGPPRAPIFVPMAFLRFLSPRGAYLDLRDFLSRRRPHQLVFATAAVAFTGLAVFEIAHDSHYVAEYHPNIIYVQQWRADRSEAEILAQQKIDKAADDKRDAAIQAEQDKQQAAYKRIDDGLKKYGL